MDDLLFLALEKRDAVAGQALDLLFNFTADDASISTLFLSLKSNVNESQRTCLFRNALKLGKLTLLINLTTNANIRALICKEVPGLFVEVLEALLKKLTKEGLQILVNLSTEQQGVEKLIDGRLAKTDAQLKGVEIMFLIDKALGAEDDEIVATGLRVILNLTHTDVGRALLLGKQYNEINFPEKNIAYFVAVVKLCLSEIPEVRRLAIDILRNCALELENVPVIISAITSCKSIDGVDANLFLKEENSILPYLLVNLVGNTVENSPYFPDDLDANKESETILTKYPDFLRQRITEREMHEIESNDACRRSLVETLYLLSDSEDGRRELDDHNAFEFISRANEVEENEDIVDLMFQLSERLLASKETEPKMQTETKTQTKDEIYEIDE